MKFVKLYELKIFTAEDVGTPVPFIELSRDTVSPEITPFVSVIDLTKVAEFPTEPSRALTFEST